MFTNIIDSIEKKLIPVMLTPKEQYVYSAVRYENRAQKQIAAELGVSQPTVSKHYTVACDKLNPILSVVAQVLNLTV